MEQKAASKPGLALAVAGIVLMVVSIFILGTGIGRNLRHVEHRRANVAGTAFGGGILTVGICLCGAGGCLCAVGFNLRKS